MDSAALIQQRRERACLYHRTPELKITCFPRGKNGACPDNLTETCSQLESVIASVMSPKKQGGLLALARQRNEEVHRTTGFRETNRFVLWAKDLPYADKLQPGASKGGRAPQAKASQQSEPPQSPCGDRPFSPCHGGCGGLKGHVSEPVSQ